MFAISVQSNAVESASQANALIAKLSNGGVTDIFYYPFQGGAHCKSSFFTASTSMKNGFDSIAYLIEHAHAAGIRVHAWFAFGASVYVLNSAWAVPSGGFTDFGNADAREAMRAITAEMVADYPDLDGVIFDYMRYPAHEAYGIFTEGDVTRAMGDCAGAIPLNMDIFVSVKPYYNNPAEWGQRWDSWYANALIDYVVPMCYSPFKYDNFERSVTWWTETAGVPRSSIMPKLSVMDTASENEASYKTDEAMATELAYWQQFGFSHLAVFDNRATVEQLTSIRALLPDEEGDDEMGIYDTLIAEADAIDARATTEASAAQTDYDARMANVAAAHLTATNLRIQAAALQEADEKAAHVADAAAVVSAML